MFWPNAIVTDSNKNNPSSLFTTTGSNTVDEAKECIKKWKNNENLLVLCAYIQDDDKKTVYMENNIDFVGNIRYSEEIKESGDIKHFSYRKSYNNLRRIKERK